MDSTKSSSQEEPQTKTKKVSPSAAIIESGGAKDSNTSTAEDTLPASLARRSSHHYESDLAHHLRRASGEAPSAELEDLQRKFHQRRESYNREDQKHVQYAYIMGQNEKEKAKPEAAKGFSES